MIVLDDIILFLGVLLVSEGATQAVVWGINKWKANRYRKKAKEFLVAPELTEQDIAIAEKCQILLAEEFPEGITARMGDMNIENRQKLIQGLLQECENIYGVKLTEIRFLTNEQIGYGTLGFFSMDTLGICINVDVLSTDDPEILRMMVSTVFHECRHAYQYRAVTDSTVDYGTEEQRRLWALNFADYIPACIDFALYQQQVVEADARLFEEECMKNCK